MTWFYAIKKYPHNVVIYCNKQYIVRDNSKRNPIKMRQPTSIYVRSYRKAGQKICAKIQRRIFRLLGKEAAPIKQPRQTISSELLGSKIRELGLQAGDCVLVHSGISNLGKVQGGPRAIFDIVQNLVGNEGTVIYPTFTFDGLMYYYCESNPTFNSLTSPSKMGSLSEYALRADGGIRSIHPTHSVVAFGAQKEAFTAHHPLCPTPFGIGTPFAELAKRSGKILLLGVGLNSTTSFHSVEDRLSSAFPVRVYKDKIFTLKCIDNQGVAQTVSTPAHDPFISRTRDCNLMKEHFLNEGIMQEFQIGNGSIALIDAKKMDDYLEYLCKTKKFTIYGKIWG